VNDLLLKKCKSKKYLVLFDIYISIAIINNRVLLSTMPFEINFTDISCKKLEWVTIFGILSDLKTIVV